MPGRVAMASASLSSPPLIPNVRGSTPYLLTATAVFLALLLRLAVDPLLGDRYPFIIFLVPFFFAAWHSGWRPAAFGLVLGFFIVDYVFLSPRGTLGLAGVSQFAGAATYFGLGTLVIAICDSL